MTFNQKTLQAALAIFSEKNRQEILEAFISSLKKHLDLCQDAQKNQNAAQLQYSAHDIKSLSYQIGAQETGAIAEKIESSLLDGRVDDAFIAVDALLPLLTDTIDVLEKES